MKTNAQGKKPGAFSGLGDMMNMGGLDDIFVPEGAGKPTFSRIKAADIRIMPQQRNSNEMESDEQTLPELAESIKANGLIAPITVVANADGTWRLVCGERRVLACELANYDPVEAMCYESLTQDQIERIQFDENVQRLNLRQINEAKVLQKDLEELGSVEAVMAKRNKNASFISKRLSLLDLPPETRKLITQRITADTEVINTVKQIEKIAPEVAAATIIELKESAGKKGSNARDIAKKAKDTVKPPKPKTEKSKPVNIENIAKPKDQSFKDAGPVKNIAVNGSDKSEEEQQDFSFIHDEPQHLLILNGIFSSIYEFHKEPKSVYEALAPDQKEAVEDWLRSFYETGITCKNLGNAVIQGFRSSTFSNQGHGAFALIAFLNGGERQIKFNTLDIIGTVKP